MIVIPDAAKPRLSGVSSRLSLALDSGYPPLADSGMTGSVILFGGLAFSPICSVQKPSQGINCK